MEKSDITLYQRNVLKELDAISNSPTWGIFPIPILKSRHSTMRENRKECYRRVGEMLKMELNTRNRIKAINTLSIPDVKYSFNVINWSVTEISKRGSKIPKLRSMHRMEHPKADIDRICLHGKKAGCGLVQMLKIATCELDTYF